MCNWAAELVIAGTGTYNTSESIALSEQAASVGVHGIMAVTPYYSKPPQQGLVRHFTAIADATDLPLMLYNMPSLTKVWFEVDTLEKLTQHRKIVGVKDSSGDIDIERTAGGVVLEDSSGDIELEDIGGDVLVRRDSSGSIYGRRIEGSVRVERDSSGEIEFRDVRDDFVVERDSSGDIVADTIGGDFRVLSDSSGDIDLRGVQGEVEIPDKG